MEFAAVCRVHAVCARWRADRPGPKTPGAGPAGSGEEIGTIVLVWDNLSVHLRAGLRAFTGAQPWLQVFRLPALRA